MAGDLAATDRIPRRVPVPVLRPALEQCRSTGVTLDGARVLIVADKGGVGDALVKRLRKAKANVLVAKPGADLVSDVEQWAAEGPVDGVYWLRALDDEGPLQELDLAGWREALRLRVKDLYAVVRRLLDSPPFLVSATRLGGYHGYDDAGATSPLGGAVTGFTKAYKREQPAVLVKAVDFPVGGRRTAALAEALVEETVRDPGCVEVGRADGARWSVGLAERPFADDGWPLQLDERSTVVVTGAAGSIVSAIVADLAGASGARFHLLDLTAEPARDDADIAAFVRDRDGLKSTIATRLKEAGERPTPVLIERQLSGVERRAAALSAIQAVEAAGGTAHYHSVDLTDPAAVARVMDEVREHGGRIDLLLHAAGLEISRSLADKEPREYDLVFDVKADGWFNLLHAAADLPIGASVVFSSVAGRFGNAGQTDYSAANDLLCKTTSSFRRTRPDTRAIALDWTAWGGIGMATRGSIPKVMEMAGIEMLPPEAGIAWIRRELTDGTGSGEVVVAGALGIMTEEFDETGGLDPAAVDVRTAGPMVGDVVAAGLYRGLVVTTTLDPKAQPFLDDHRIDGTALLPGVMAVEGMAEVARLLVPGRCVVAVEDVDFLAPLKFYKDEPRELTIRARLRRDGDDVVADCRLEAQRQLPGTEAPQVTVHHTARVRLAAERPSAGRATVPERRTGEVLGPDVVYRAYFHGPAYQVVDAAWRYDGGDAAQLKTPLPPNHAPAEAPTVLDPRLLELCFQAAGLYEIGHDGRYALPLHVDRIVPGKDRAAAKGALYAVAAPGAAGFSCTVVDGAGDVVVRVDGYRTVELPGAITDELRAQLSAVMHD